jgi:hypothetical protein
MLTLGEGCYQVLPHIECEPFDDADGHGFDPLERWGDRRFCAQKDRYLEWAALNSD